MKVSSVFLLASLFSVLIIIGCSSNKSNPVIPVDEENELDLPFVESDKTEEEHKLLGAFTATFDIETLKASVEQDRTLNTHHNVTGMIPDPLITVNSWDPAEEIVDVDVQLHNPTWTSVYDVRLIIYTDSVGHMLLNDDNWTPLWDIPGGQIANPFKAYAKYEPNRVFSGENFHQENFKIKCPNSNFTVLFAVDCSYPSNCEEPYEIRDFSQGMLKAITGSTTEISVSVFDRQDDVSTVKLHCPLITGISLIELEQLSDVTWGSQLTNETGAQAGEYTGYIMGYSVSSNALALYDEIKISIRSLDDTGWVVTWGNENSDSAFCITLDGFGSVSAGGEFKGTIDFDPGPGVVEYSSMGSMEFEHEEWVWVPSSDSYISTYDQDSNFQWADGWGAVNYDACNGLAGESSDIYATGRYDYDYSFYRKYNSAGSLDFDLRWEAKANDIALDDSGNIYITGKFGGPFYPSTYDFDPGPGVEERTTVGLDDIFLSKFTTDGQFLWVRTWGGEDLFDEGISLAATDDSVFVIGSFDDTVDFDPGPGVVEHTAIGFWGTFVSKFDSSGNFIWVKTWDISPSLDDADVKADISDNIYTCGSFTGTVDFNPGPDVDIISSIGGGDVYLTKLYGNGGYQWTLTWGGSSGDRAYAIGLYDDEFVYITGSFVSTVDFDPGPDVYEIEGNLVDAYLSKFTSDGDFVWVRTWGGTGHDKGKDIVVDDDGDLFLVGQFQYDVDFDPGPGLDIRSAHGQNSADDVYILKLLPNGYWE